jgi:CRP-like cAMP-binding protein
MLFESQVERDKFIFDIITSCRIFASADECALAEILAASTPRRWNKYFYLYVEDQTAESCFLIATGRVGIISTDPWGKPCMLAIKGPGELLGDLSLFDEHPRTSSAKALEKTTGLEIAYSPLKQTLLTRPKLLSAFLRVYAERIRTDDEHLVDALALDLTNRLAKRLLEIAGIDQQFTLDITQTEIASLVGASRERTSKAIASLVRMGAISVDNHTYRIVNRKKLELLAMLTHRARLRQ